MEVMSFLLDIVIVLEVGVKERRRVIGRIFRYASLVVE